MARKNSAADAAQTAGAVDGGAANTNPHPSPLPLAGEGTVCPHRGNGGSYVVNDATQTRTPNTQPTEE